MNRSQAAVLTLLLFWPVSASAQAVIESPSKPVAKDAGRVLALTEVWRITDEAGPFFFQYPRDLQIADDGSVFLHDVNQFLKFSPEGRFLKDLFKKGQGPGELADGAFQYHIHGRDLFILGQNSGRFWRADFEGRFQEQYDITKILDPAFIGVVPEGFLFLTFVWPPRSEFTGKTVSVPHELVLLGRDGPTARGLLKFEHNIFLAPHEAMSDTLIMTQSPDGKSLYAFNGWDYMIEVLDAASGATVKKFRRSYPKARLILTPAQEEGRRRNNLPKYDYGPDISNLYPTAGHLWVETSTEDKAKGRLYDVFDKDGRFVDSFYLGPGKTLMAVQEGIVFCQEKGPDDTIVIVKYRIGE
ncbi:MAG: hypothetical protein ACXW2V_06380 [Candidatus Aminicenantales bacterium]